MGVDYTPTKELNPMGRSVFDKMSPKDQSRFCLEGGELFEDRPEHLKKPERGLITSISGATISAEEWDALSVKEQAAFITGGSN